MAFQMTQGYNENLAKLIDPSFLSIPELHSDSTSDRDDFDSRDGLSAESKKIHKLNIRRDKYNVIPNQVRVDLIDAILNNGEKIKHAATRLGINYSSAKSIFQVYKKEGRFDKKSSKKNYKNGLAKKINIEANLINESPRQVQDSITLSLDFSPIYLEPKVEQAKTSKPLQIPKHCLEDLESLGLELRRSESMTTCATNALSFSRNSSLDSEIEQPRSKAPDTTTFFGMLEDKEHTSDFRVKNSAFSRVLKQKIYSSALSKPDIHIPEYQPRLSQKSVPTSSIQDLSLIQELNLVSQQLSQLRGINNLLAQYRDQALMPFNIHQRVLGEQYSLLNVLLEDKLDSILTLKALLAQNLGIQIERPQVFEPEVPVDIPPLEIRSNPQVRSVPQNFRFTQ